MSELMDHLDQLYTTELGVLRIKRNLCLPAEMDALAYCQKQIATSNTEIVRRGKNFYVTTATEMITIHAKKLSIITAHKVKK